MANIIPREKRARLLYIIGEMGVSIMWRGGGQPGAGFLLYIPVLVGSLLGGYIYEANPQSLWYMLTVSAFIGTFLIFRYVREPEKPED